MCGGQLCVAACVEASCVLQCVLVPAVCVPGPIVNCLLTRDRWSVYRGVVRSTVSCGYLCVCEE